VATGISGPVGVAVTAIAATLDVDASLNATKYDAAHRRLARHPLSVSA